VGFAHPIVGQHPALLPCLAGPLGPDRPVEPGVVPPANYGKLMRRESLGGGVLAAGPALPPTLRAKKNVPSFQPHRPTKNLTSPVLARPTSFRPRALLRWCWTTTGIRLDHRRRDDCNAIHPPHRPARADPFNAWRRAIVRVGTPLEHGPGPLRVRAITKAGKRLNTCHSLVRPPRSTMWRKSSSATKTMPLALEIIRMKQLVPGHLSPESTSLCFAHQAAPAFRALEEKTHGVGLVGPKSKRPEATRKRALGPACSGF